jgi:Hypothetical protein (DUF2513)
MKRDMDIVRKILALVEDQPAGDPVNGMPTIGDASPATIAEHVQIMTDAGLLTGQVIGSSEQGYGVLIFGLTWKGHDFLESIRNDTIWNKIRTKIKSAGAGMTIEIIKELATSYIRETLQMK